MKFRYLLSISLISVTACILLVIFLMKDKFIFDYNSTAKVEVIKQWSLPESLKEVSGIYYLGQQKMACVQDEKGIVYVFDLETSQVSRQLRFTPDGDFEGITAIEKRLFLLRSDGVLFDVNDYTATKPIITKTALFKEKDIDVEGLCTFSNQKLLIGIKASDALQPSGQVLVYNYNLDTHQLDEFIRIDNNHDIFKTIPKEHPSRNFNLSEVAYHQSTFYITEARTPKLLILDQNRKPQHLIYLSEADFPQPEGIAFNEEGDLFIASEENNNESQNINLIKIITPN